MESRCSATRRAISVTTLPNHYFVSVALYSRSLGAACSVSDNPGRHRGAPAIAAGPVLRISTMPDPAGNPQETCVPMQTRGPRSPRTRPTSTGRPGSRRSRGCRKRGSGPSWATFGPSELAAHRANPANTIRARQPIAPRGRTPGDTRLCNTTGTIPIDLDQCVKSRCGSFEHSAEHQQTGRLRNYVQGPPGMPWASAQGRTDFAR